MNLVACPACNCHYDFVASVCPHCGEALERSSTGQIKRTSAAIVLGLASVALPSVAVMGCGDSSGTGGAGGAGTSSTISATSTTTKATTGVGTTTASTTVATTGVASAYGAAVTTTTSTSTGNQSSSTGN